MKTWNFSIPALLLLSVSLSASFAQGPEKALYQCKPGPWGELEYYYTYLEAPPWIVESMNTPSEKTVWHLPEKDISQLRDFLRTTGISGEDVETILRVSIPYQTAPPFRLFPPPEIVESLSRSTRSSLAIELRKWPANQFYRSPVVIGSGSVKDWFDGSGLSSDTLAKIESLTYPVGHTTTFSDVPHLLSTIHSDAEERLLLKALTRTRSLILRLRIGPDTDIDSLQSYWSAGFKNKDISTIFESIARTPGVDQLDIAHLLPPLPRKYLYTYPSSALGLEGTFPDSYWTSLNFFHYLPEEVQNDPEWIEQYCQSNYVRSGLPFEFGDLLFVKDPITGRRTHACVYVADDIVYTKNGRSLYQPFLLMKFRDLLARYGDGESSRFEAWRKRNPTDSR